jgi:hypothetical protein
MFMRAIDLETSDLSTELMFYTQVLGLPLRQARAASFTVQAGTTALIFRSSSQQPLLYHFAFTVPLNKWQHATAGEDFGPGDVLHISEMGLVVDDVPGTVKQLKIRLGIEVYRDSSFDDFAQPGDINGVLVLSKRGRPWFPDERQPAVVSPVRVSLLGALAQQITLEPYPYVLDVVPLTRAE